MNQTTDYMYVLSPDEKPLLRLGKYKGHICHTVYDGAAFQVFYTEGCNAVFNKEKEQVVELPIDSWTRLVLKLETIVKT